MEEEGDSSHSDGTRSTSSFIVIVDTLMDAAHSTTNLDPEASGPAARGEDTEETNTGHIMHAQCHTEISLKTNMTE